MRDEHLPAHETSEAPHLDEEHRPGDRLLPDIEARLPEVQRLARLGFFSFDAVQGVWMCSAFLDEMLGLEHKPKTLSGLVECIHPDDRAKAVAHAESLLTTPGSFDGEYRLAQPGEGRTRWIRITGEFTRDGRGRALAMFGIAQDISEQKAREEEARRLEAKLPQVQKAAHLRTLAGGVAHEFNNLLTSVLGHADLLRRDLPSDSAGRESLRAIEDAARRAAEISQQMLAFSGRGKSTAGPLHVSRIVREMSRLLEVSSSKARLQLELAEEPPLVEADGGQLRDLLLGLVVHAGESLEKTREGQITIRTGTVSSDGNAAMTDMAGAPLPPGEYAFLEVAHNGPGPSSTARGLTPDPSSSTRGGQDLALPEALGAARQSGSRVQVVNRPGVSAVRVLFPASGRPSSLKSPAEAPSAAERPRRVLVIDDEEMVRTLTQRMLTRCGYRACSAAGGAEALEILRAEDEKTDLVLLDLTMPGLSGEETLQQIQQVAPGVPVVVSSGAGEEAVSRMRALGAVGFLQKPYQMTALRSAVESALGSERH